METVYLPARFRAEDAALARRLASEHPLATIFTWHDRPFVSHLPLLFDGERLLGHLARANPHADLLRGGAQALVVFRGPDAYVSPRWYRIPDVPTWNYCVAHVGGTARLVEGAGALDATLRCMQAAFDPDWPYERPEDLASDDALTSAIVALEVQVQSVELKLKLSQNRRDDRVAIAAALRARGKPDDILVAEWMERCPS